MLDLGQYIHKSSILDNFWENKVSKFLPTTTRAW